MDNFGAFLVNTKTITVIVLVYHVAMLGLNQDTVDFIIMVAVVHMVPFLGMFIVAMLMRQLRRFGFTHSWGENARDIKFNDF